MSSAARHDIADAAELIPSDPAVGLTFLATPGSTAAPGLFPPIKRVETGISFQGIRPDPLDRFHGLFLISCNRRMAQWYQG